MTSGSKSLPRLSVLDFLKILKNLKCDCCYCKKNGKWLINYTEKNTFYFLENSRKKLDRERLHSILRQLGIEVGVFLNAFKRINSKRGRR